MNRSKEMILGVAELVRDAVAIGDAALARDFDEARFRAQMLATTRMLPDTSIQLLPRPIWSLFLVQWALSLRLVTAGAFYVSPANSTRWVSTLCNRKRHGLRSAQGLISLSTAPRPKFIGRPGDSQIASARASSSQQKVVAGHDSNGGGSQIMTCFSRSANAEVQYC